MRITTTYFLRSAVLAVAILVATIFPFKAEAGGEVTIAILPWKLNAGEGQAYLGDALVDMLTSRLGSSGDVYIVRADLVEDAYRDHGVSDATGKVAESVGATLGAGFVLYGSLSMLGEHISLDASLLNIEDGSRTPLYFKGKGLESIIGMTEELASGVLEETGVLEDAGVAGQAESLPLETVQVQSTPTYQGKFAPESVPEPVSVEVPPSSKGGEPATETEAPPKKKPSEAKAGDGFIVKKKSDDKESFLWKSKPIDGHYKSIVAADLDGDGSEEFFLISNKEIFVGRVADDKFEKVATIDAGGGVKNVSISSGDFDGNGRVELYVSRLRGSVEESVVIEYVRDEFKVVASAVSWFLRAIIVPGEGDVLIGQRFDKNWGFRKEISVFKFDGSRVSEMEAFSVPPKLDLYGFEFFDITGDGNMEVVALDDRGYIRVYGKGEGGQWVEGWRSSERFGGTLNVIEHGDEDADSLATEFTLIRGGFFLADIGDGGDGRIAGLFIKKNVAGGVFGESAERVRAYKSGSILNLGWDGALFAENWRTSEITGYIADFLVTRADDGNNTVLTLLVVEKGRFLSKGEKSYVLSYKLDL